MTSMTRVTLLILTLACASGEPLTHAACPPTVPADLKAVQDAFNGPCNCLYLTCNDNNTEWTRECNRLYSFEHPQTDNLPWLRSLTARQIQCIEYAAMMPAIPPCASPNDIACVTKTRKTRAYVLNACETGAKCDEPGAKSRMDP